MAKRVFVHVGAPKCGTTFLQSMLWSNRERLARDGVLLPGRHRRLFDHRLALMALRHPEPRDGGKRRAQTTYRELLDQIDATSGDALLTNEWFVKATAAQAARARRDLAGAEVHLVLTARAFVGLVPAAWQESLKVGEATSLPDFVRGLDGDRGRWSWRVLDPARALPRWAGDLDPARVHVVTVPPRSDDPMLLWKRFAGVVGLDAGAYDSSRVLSNESLGVVAAGLLQRLGPTLREAIDVEHSHWTEPYRWIQDFLSHELLLPLGGSQIGVGPDEAGQLYARSVETAESLAAAGYDVVGDLDELLVREPPPDSRDPESVTDAELLEVATAVIPELLVRARAQILRSEAATVDPPPA
jgi:hypothetical protein